jgi:hypothetical protein
MYLILLVAIISPFIFVNMYQMFDHFHKAGNEALAKEKSTFVKLLSKKKFVDSYCTENFAKLF